MRDIASFYGNCQAEALGQILGDHEPFNRLFRIEPVTPVHRLNPEDRGDVAKAASRAKLFVHQPVGPDYEAASTENIVRAFSPGIISVCFPVLWFDGYGPDVQYLKINGQTERGGPSDYHSALVIDAFLVGWTAERTASLYDDPALVDAETIQRVVADTLARQRQREELDQVNLVVSDLIADRYAELRLFNTMNHPTGTMLSMIANRLLDRLGIPHLSDDVMAKHDDALGGTRLPELASINRALGLRFPRQTSFLARGAVKSAVEFVATYFDFYRRVTPAGPVPIGFLAKGEKFFA